MIEDKKRILIIEDEILIAEEISSTLILLGYSVEGIIMNGDRALDAIMNLRPDLILLDIHIKGSLSGIDLAHIIRKKHALPFVFLTAYSDKDTLEKAKKTMPYGYILKPFNETTIKVNLEMAFFKHSAERQRNLLTKNYIEKKYQTNLSEREYGVLEAFIRGFTYKKTADKNCISVNTVKSYQKRLYQIFEVDSKAALMQKFLNNT